MVVHPGGGRRCRPTAPRRADGSGTVGVDDRHHEDAGQGGADHRPAPRRVEAEHAGDGRGHQGARRGRRMMRIGVLADLYRDGGVDFVRDAERLGADAVWAPEFWAGDAFTPLAYLAGVTSKIRLATAIVQLGSRTPAMLAMT